MADVETERAEPVSVLKPQRFVEQLKGPLAPLIVARPLAKVASRLFGPQDPSEDAPKKESKAGFYYLMSLLLFVIAPSLIISIYFAFIASDQYSAEARFAVTSARFELSEKIEKAKANLSGGVPSAATQDVYIISAYVHSRAIVDEISKTTDLREIFRRPEADLWARLGANASTEELVDYWRSMVGVYVDSMSGIVTITVRAFRRDDALMLCEKIVKASEQLANSVSSRAQQATMKLAEVEVEHAESRVASSLSDLRQFREQVGFIDPTSQAKTTYSILTDLLSERIKLQNQYFVSSRAMSKEAPTVQTMKAHLDSLDDQIAEQRAKLTGNSGETDTISSLMPKYESLELQNRFAEKIYTLAEDGLERARMRAEAQSIFVNAFVPPSLPQEAEFPKRLYISLSIAAVLAVLWGIAAMIIAVVEDHVV